MKEFLINGIRNIYKKYFYLKLLEPFSMDTADLNEEKMETRITDLNKAAEDYFKLHAEEFSLEHLKPFMPDYNSTRLLIRLGWMLSELTFNKNLTVLDFGCGLGWLSFYLNKLGFNVIGLDVSPTAVQEAEKIISELPDLNKSNTYHFLSYDGNRFPLSDSSVHYILTFDSFHHVPNQAKVLKEMYRILTPGGKLVMSEPGIGHVDKPDTAEEVKRFSVLERDTNILIFEKKAREAGFKNPPYLLPFHNVVDYSIPRIKYHEFMEGYVDTNMLNVMRMTLLTMPVIVCRKKGKLERSFYHRAAIKDYPKKIKLRCGVELEIEFQLTNKGSLSFQSRQHPFGGHVYISCRMIDRDKGTYEFERLSLENDLIPRESISLKLKMKAPQISGEFIIELEPVCANFYNFSDYGFKIATIKLKVFQ